MGYKILRFVGALVAANLFIFLVQLFHLVCMDSVILMFANFSWRSLFSFDVLRGGIIPIVWFIFYLMVLGIGWIVRGSKIIAALPLICFLGALINLFYILFVNPQSSAIDEVGLGIWYYSCAIITFIIIVGWMIGCALFMFTDQEE